MVGLLIIKFPKLVSFLGKLPGDFSIGGKIFIPLSSAISISLVVSILSLIFSFILRLIK